MTRIYYLGRGPLGLAEMLEVLERALEGASLVVPERQPSKFAELCGHLLPAEARGEHAMGWEPSGATYTLPDLWARCAAYRGAHYGRRGEVVPRRDLCPPRLPLPCADAYAAAFTTAYNKARTWRTT